MKNAILSFLLFSSVFSFAMRQDGAAPLDSPGHDARRAVRDFVADYLSRREEQSHQQALMDPVKTNQTKKSDLQRSPAASNLFHDSVFIQRSLVEKDARGACLYITPDNKRALAYAENHVCVMRAKNPERDLGTGNIEFVRPPLELHLRNKTVHAVALGRVDRTNTERIIIGDCDGCIHMTEQIPIKLQQIGQVDDAGCVVQILPALGQKSVFMAIRYLLKHRQVDECRAAVTSIDTWTRTENLSPRMVFTPIPEEQGPVDGLSFLDDTHLETMHGDNRKCIWEMSPSADTPRVTRQ